MIKKAVYINRWFALFVSIHVFFWTLLPSLLRFNLPMDALEGAIWGRHFAFGYDKNPFLNGWLTGLAVKLGGTQGWSIYLLSQLAVVMCFIAVFQLAKKILSPVHAFIAVLLLELIGSYNIDAIDFDDNVLELSLWALTLLFFYLAIKKQRIRDWIFVGLFAGLSMMTKYYFVVLLLPMFLLLLINPEARESFKKLGLYLAAFIFILICLPHVWWLFSHNFVTIQYAIGRVHDQPVTWIQHFIYPWQFLKPYLEACLPPLILFATLWIGQKRQNIISEKRRISRETWQFLLLLGFGPLIITLLLSLLFGFILNAGWGVPLMSLWGIILLAAVQPTITIQKFYRFIILFFILLFAGFFAYSISLLRAGDSSSAHYPGRIMATRITKSWHQKYHTRLAYVVGQRWTAGNVAFYSKDKPALYMSADPKKSFWINENDLRKKGAVFIWDVDKYGVSPIQYRRFKLIGHRVESFRYFRAPHAKPVRLGMAFLKPA